VKASPAVAGAGISDLSIPANAAPNMAARTS